MGFNLHRQHKVASLISALFLIMFCLSGILLNHRNLIDGVEVSRAVLPPFYRYHNWNGGLLRSTLTAGGKTLVYGNSGIWITDGNGFADFNRGLPDKAEYRRVMAMAVGVDSTIFAATTRGLYRYDDGWRQLPLPAEAAGEALADMTVRGDTLVVLSRDRLYLATPPYAQFSTVTLRRPADYDGTTTLFRNVWLLHSGQLFGMAGRLVADAVGLILIFICLSGFAVWLLPKGMRRRAKRGENVKKAGNRLKLWLKMHRKTGIVTAVLTILIVFTGWCLRPPVLILLATTRTPVIPGTILDSDNPWHDKLRMVRYDAAKDRWLLSTSAGFYALRDLDGIPVRVKKQPPVSVMGLNVWAAQPDGSWLCGSFSGLYRWDTMTDKVTDAETGETPPDKPGPPFGKTAVSGYTDAFGTPVVVTYDYGARNIAVAYAQPDSLATLPMPLWNVALEVHTGRIYFGNNATYWFVFVIGAVFMWALVTGLLVARRKRKPAKPPRAGQSDNSDNSDRSD